MKHAFGLLILLVALSGRSFGQELYQAEYHYDSRGMLTNQVEIYPSGVEASRNLDYDALGRIVREELGQYQVQYDYDHLGNRLRQTQPGTPQQIFHYNNRNELIQHDLESICRNISYDLNGSMTQKIEGACSTSYEWDSRGRLTQVQTNGVVIFRADYAGGLKRLSKTEGDLFKLYRHDGSTVIQEVEQSGAVKELVRSDRGTSTVGGILYSGDEQGTNTYTYNGVGSTVALRADDGTVKMIQYDAFGRILSADEGVETERLANTKERDQSTGLYFHGARYYDAQTGRYVSADPARDGINFYVYANNAPFNFVDPTGLSSEGGGVWDTFFAPTIDAINWLGRKTFIEPLETVYDAQVYMAEMGKIPMVNPLGKLGAGLGASAKGVVGAANMARTASRAKPIIGFMDDLPPIANTGRRSIGNGIRTKGNVADSLEKTLRAKGVNPDSKETGEIITGVVKSQFRAQLGRDVKNPLAREMLAAMDAVHDGGLPNIVFRAGKSERYYAMGTTSQLPDGRVLIELNYQIFRPDEIPLVCFHECVHALQYLKKTSLSSDLHPVLIARAEASAEIRTARWLERMGLQTKFTPKKALIDQHGKKNGMQLWKQQIYDFVTEHYGELNKDLIAVGRP